MKTVKQGDVAERGWEEVWKDLAYEQRSERRSPPVGPQGKSVSGSGNSTCKGPEMGAQTAYSRNTILKIMINFCVLQEDMNSKFICTQ